MAPLKYANELAHCACPRPLTANHIKLCSKARLPSDLSDYHTLGDLVCCVETTTNTHQLYRQNFTQQKHRKIGVSKFVCCTPGKKCNVDLNLQPPTTFTFREKYPFYCNFKPEVVDYYTYPLKLNVRTFSKYCHKLYNPLSSPETQRLNNMLLNGKLINKKNTANMPKGMLSSYNC